METKLSYKPNIACQMESKETWVALFSGSDRLIVKLSLLFWTTLSAQTSGNIEVFELHHTWLITCLSIITGCYWPLACHCLSLYFDSIYFVVLCLPMIFVISWWIGSTSMCVVDRWVSSFLNFSGDISVPSIQEFNNFSVEYVSTVVRILCWHLENL